MDLREIVELAQTGIVGFLIVILGTIRIPKLDLNFWSWLARSLGRAINKEEIEQLKKLTRDFEEHLRIEEKEKIRQARQRILRFNDEILFGKRHSKEHFDEILEDIDTYEKFCEGNPDYKNNKAMLAIRTIKEVYEECTKTHDFLIYENKKR